MCFVHEVEFLGCNHNMFITASLHLSLYVTRHMLTIPQLPCLDAARREAALDREEVIRHADNDRCGLVFFPLTNIRERARCPDDNHHLFDVVRTRAACCLNGVKQDTVRERYHRYFETRLVKAGRDYDEWLKPRVNDFSGHKDEWLARRAYLLQQHREVRG